MSIRHYLNESLQRDGGHIGDGVLENEISDGDGIVCRYRIHFADFPAGQFRNMTSVFLCRGGRVLMLYRQGSRVVNNLWVGAVCDGSLAGDRPAQRSPVRRYLK